MSPTLKVVAPPAATRLSDLPDGHAATVARVQNNDPELLRYLGRQHTGEYAFDSVHFPKGNYEAWFNKERKKVNIDLYGFKQ